MGKLILRLLLIFLFTVLSCPAWSDDAPVPEVVVSIKPIHALVAGVMQGVGQPQLLVKGGGSPHGYVLRPSEARALSQADLIVWVGHQLEPFLEKPLSTLGQKASQLELMESLRSELLPFRAGGDWDAHRHQEAAGTLHASETDHPSHSKQELNPHLWLDPNLAKKVVAQTAALLSRIDSGRQTIYRQNAERLQQRLDQLDQQLSDRLAPVKDVPYLVFHDAFQYFEIAYGLNAVGSITVDPERKPGIKRLLEIRKKIKQVKARCVFSEPQFEPRLVATIIEQTGAKTGELDPLGAQLATGEESYFELMNHLADDLLAGLL